MDTGPPCLKPKCGNGMVKCHKDAAHPYYCWVCNKKCPACYNKDIGWRTWRSPKETNSDKLEAIKLEHEQRPLREGDYSLSFEMELANLRIYNKWDHELKPGANSKDAFWKGPDGHFDVETGNSKFVIPEFVPDPWYSNSGRTYEQWLNLVTTLDRLYEHTRGGKKKVMLKDLYGDQGDGVAPLFTIGLAPGGNPLVVSTVQTNFSIRLWVLGKCALKGLDPFAAFGEDRMNNARKVRNFLLHRLPAWSKSAVVDNSPDYEVHVAVGFWWCALYFLCMECLPDALADWDDGSSWKYRYDFLPRVSLYQIAWTGLKGTSRVVAFSMFGAACEVFKQFVERPGATFSRDFLGLRRARGLISDCFAGQWSSSKNERNKYLFTPKDRDKKFPAAESVSFVLALLEERLAGKSGWGSGPDGSSVRLDRPLSDQDEKDLHALMSPTRTKLFDCTSEDDFRVIIEHRVQESVNGTGVDVRKRLTELKNLVETVVKGPP